MIATVCLVRQRERVGHRSLARDAPARGVLSTLSDPQPHCYCSILPNLPRFGKNEALPWFFTCQPLVNYPVQPRIGKRKTPPNQLAGVATTEIGSCPAEECILPDARSRSNQRDDRLPSHAGLHFGCCRVLLIYIHNITCSGAPFTIVNNVFNVLFLNRQSC